jgi:hypothetical protein
MESLPDSIQNAWLIQKHIKTDKKLKKSLKVPKGQPESVISDTYFRDDVDDESSDGGIPLCRRSDWSIFCGNRRIYV